MNDYALIWKQDLQHYELYELSDAKTQLNILDTIAKPELIENRLIHDWTPQIEKHGTG